MAETDCESTVSAFQWPPAYVIIYPRDLILDSILAHFSCAFLTAELLMLPALPIVHQKGEKVNKNIWFSTSCLKMLIELSDSPAGENIAP